MSNTLRFLQNNMRGWNRAWGIIAAKYGDVYCRAPNGEEWQYMSSTDTEHQFRHRDLIPNDQVGQGRRVYENIPIEAEDFDHIRPYPTIFNYLNP